MTTRLVAEAHGRREVRADVVQQSGFDFYGVFQKGLFEVTFAGARRVSSGVSRRKRLLDDARRHAQRDRLQQKMVPSADAPKAFLI